MSEVDKHLYFTAQIQVDTQTGEAKAVAETVSDSVGDKKTVVRLSPVNNRVLSVLINNAGQVVTRQLIFDTVWPNQVVSDDALTRCISDLRAQLKPLTEVSLLINTIPKVGYRWLPEVSLTRDMSEVSSQDTVRTVHQESLWSRQLKPMLWALGLLLLLLWTLLAGLYWWYQPSATTLVILPTQFLQADSQGQSDVAALLKKATQKHDKLQYVSQFAIQSHQGSPFPYFSHEFGVRWFIESRIEPMNEKTQLTLNLVDAKTALVIYSQQFTVTAETSLEVHCQSFVDFVAAL